MSSAWLVALVALLAADAGTGTRLHRDAPLYCYTCEVGACAAGELRAASCPRERPLCATIAYAPDFSTKLKCTEFTNEACTFATINATSRVSCVCSSDLCNRPFSQEFIHHLNTTSADFTNSSDILNNFTNIYANPSDVIAATPAMTKIISPVTTTVGVVTDPNEPRVEALKSSVPSEDDEDESEGSGSLNDYSKKRPASDPAAPSSHLPAEGNRAASAVLDVLVVTSILFHFI